MAQVGGDSIVVVGGGFFLPAVVVGGGFFLPAVVVRGGFFRAGCFRDPESKTCAYRFLLMLELSP
jgi:hypothetical protein